MLKVIFFLLWGQNGSREPCREGQRWGGFFEFSNLHDTSSAGPSEVNHNPTEEILTSKRCDPSSAKIDESLTNNNILHELATTKGLCIASLNINSLLKHIDQLRMIMQTMPVDIFAINETKIDESLSDNEIFLAIISYVKIEVDMVVVFFCTSAKLYHSLNKIT